MFRGFVVGQSPSSRWRCWPDAMHQHPEPNGYGANAFGLRCTDAQRAGCTVLARRAGSLSRQRPGGSPGRKLTEGPFDTQPAPSPDRSHVAFVRQGHVRRLRGDLWVLADLTPQIAPAGSPSRRLADPAAPVHEPGDAADGRRSRWSPNGDQVAFVDNPTGGAVVWRRSAGGSDRHRRVGATPPATGRDGMDPALLAPDSLGARRSPYRLMNRQRSDVRLDRCQRPGRR